MATIKTKQLQRLINIVAEGAGCNQLIPESFYIYFQHTPNGCILHTTDFNNYVSVVTPIELTGDIVVNANLMKGLVSKLAGEETYLEVVDNCLKVVDTNSQSEYSVPLYALDEDKKSMIIGSECINLVDNPTTDLGLTQVDISNILKHNLPACSTDKKAPELCSVWFGGSQVLSTDSYVASRTFLQNSEIEFPNILVSAETIKLLKVFTGSVFVEFGENNIIKFYKDGISVIGHLLNSEFPYEIVLATLNNLERNKEEEYVLPTSQMLKALDRIRLFMSEFDDIYVIMRLEANGDIILENGYKTVKERLHIDYHISEWFEYKININFIETALKQYNKDAIVNCSNKESITFIFDDCAYMISVEQ